MLNVSADFQRVVKGSHNRIVTARIALPTTVEGVYDTPVEFDVSGGSITANLNNGQRYEANLNIVPDDTRRWSDLLSTPGALFTVDVGVRISGTNYESCRLFTGELSSAPSLSYYGDGFDLTCQDQWVRLLRCRFTSVYTTPASSRAAIMTHVVTGAIPGVTVIASPAASAGHEGGVVTDKLRTDLIVDLANDADPDYSVGFNAEGAFTINTSQTDLQDPVVTITDGETGTLIDFQNVREVDKMYNCVVVKPSSFTQDWSQVIVEITDTSHPRHKSKIGVVPYFVNAPTASSTAVALNIGTLRLQRILAEQSTLRISAVDNPALEPGDVVNVAMRTGPNAGEIIPAVITSISRDILTARMDLEAQRNIDTDIGEVEEA